METDIAMMTAGYVLTRLAFVAVFAYLVFRAIRPQPKPRRVRVQSDYANERTQLRRRGM